MIPRSLGFHIQKSIRAYEILHVYKTFTVPWIFLSGTPYERKFFFYISKAVDLCVREGIFFLYRPKCLERPAKYIRVETYHSCLSSYLDSLVL